MMHTDVLHQFQEALGRCSAVKWQGRVLRVTGNLIESHGPYGSVGEECEVQGRDGQQFRGEIIGFRDRIILSLLTETPVGIRLGDPIISKGSRPSIGVGTEMLGRVLDANGTPIDGGGPYRSTAWLDVDGCAPLPLQRKPILEPLGCGIRAIDAFISCGRGQRLGIFGGSGVGKSTLLGMMSRGTAADAVVMALVGERGREVGEFLEVLGEHGRRRSVIVVSTSNEPALLRLRAPMLATAVAEGLAAEGLNVLLVVDSLTRFAMAQREIGLAAGEPPTMKGYTPSVLTKLACLVERAGNFSNGSITGFYTVLMEGDDQQDPVVDTVRSLLDGHIMLDRSLATRGHYPPISVLDSLSRLMPGVATHEHLSKALGVRELLAAYARSEDLIRIGAYQKGADPLLDNAIAHLPAIEAYLKQSSSEVCSRDETVRRLLELPS